MYNWEKSPREDKLRKNPRNPSFSSSLLDEIYREIDGGGDERHKELMQKKEKNAKKQNSSSNGGSRAVKGSNSTEDEEMASLRRACLIEKWMEKKINEKVSTRIGSSLPEFDPKLMQDNDPLFFSSGSSSSDSSFGGFSSSETESLGTVKTRSSCFAASRPAPIKTSVMTGKLEHSAAQSEFYLFDEYSNHQTNKIGESLIKSKARALKIYANLKKVKQPISPGGRLTNFINSLFTNGNPKKNKNLSLNGSCNYDGNVDWKTKSAQASTCSSATTFSRSCLSKNSPNSREKRNNGIKRSVRFFPVSVIVDEDSRPCGHKCIYDEERERFGRRTNGDKPKLPVMDRRNYDKGNEVLRNYQSPKKDDFVARIVRDDFEDDDAASDSSSDLFELDHLELLKNDKFCEDLPVYETTDFGLNRAIASGLIG